LKDILVSICAKKREHVKKQKHKFSELFLLSRISEQEPPRGFFSALSNQTNAGMYGLIAEIKKASPSKGLIRKHFDPANLARAYESGGATCLSVLTDEPYFKGADIFLSQARNATNLPVLRKDFMIDPYQIIEARAIGADCILIIMACLDDKEALDLKIIADELKMDVLIEVHSSEEMERALKLSPNLIGINNRNLKNLNVDLSTTEKLVPMVTNNVLIVSESGLYKHDDLLRIKATGVNCFLVGESLMRERDVEAATRRLLCIDAKPQI
jgi:indole-3-glycerol phosphate synthase